MTELPVPPLLKIMPRVSPVGVLEPGDNDLASPRVYPPALRVVALVVLGLFFAVVVVSTSLSLGSYCLTTDAGSASPLPAGPPSTLLQKRSSK